MARNINSQGEVVGFHRLDGWHGFHHYKGEYTPIDFPGADWTHVQDNNPRGDLVGRYGLAGVWHAFLWRKGDFITIDPPGSEWAAAPGINSHGQIVGYFGDSEGAEHGFLLDGEGYTQIDFPDAVLTWATAINAPGDIVGWYALPGENPSDVRHGFLMTR
jgi:probable HAF family extracellular repeat protein